MEKESRLLLALLRIVVKKQADESIPSDVDWEKLMNIATTQVVPVVVLDSLQLFTLTIYLSHHSDCLTNHR